MKKYKSILPKCKFRIRFRKEIFKSKKFIISGAAIVIVITTVVICVVKLKNVDASANKSESNKYTVKSGTLQLSVSDSATASQGSTGQLFEIETDNPDIELEVEEVYISSGDEYEKGSKLLKISQEDISQAIDYYEKLVSSCEATLNKEKIEYESALIEEDSTYESNLQLKDSALTEYNTEIADLQDKVDTAKKNYNEAKEEIEELNEKIDDNTYYEDYDLKNLKSKVTSTNNALNSAKNSDEYKKICTNIKTYEDDIRNLEESIKKQQKTVEEKKKNYLSKLDELVKQASGNSSVESEYVSDFNSAYSDWDNANKKYEDIQKQLTDKKSELEKLNKQKNQLENSISKAQEDYKKAKETYEKALENYNNAIAEAKTNIDELTDSLESLNNSYKDALNDQKNSLLEIENEYKNSLLTSNNADVLHDIALLDLDSSVEEAENNLKAAKDDLEYFESIKDDGIVYTSQDGTISSVPYETGDTIELNSAIAYYVNSDTVNVSINVPQEDIASVSVGEEVTVASSSGKSRGLSGTVSEISTSPVSEGSVSTVEYQVTVEIDNTNANISSSDTITVSIPIETLEDVIYVPINAVKSTGSSKYVTLKKSDGTTEKCFVTTGKDNGIYIEIKSGLSQGDICLIETT